MLCFLSLSRVSKLAVQLAHLGGDVGGILYCKLKIQITAPPLPVAIALTRHAQALTCP